MYRINHRSSVLLEVISILIVSLMIFAFGCAKKEEKEIKIGAILPLTGDNASYGTAIQKGIELGLEEINKVNGINGKKLTILFEDDQADPQKSVAAYKKLTSVDKVPMILGGVFSASTLAIAPLAEKDKVVLLSPTSSAVEITQAGDYIFRIYPSDAYDGIFLADFTVKELKAKTASILYMQVASISAITKVFREQFEANGGKLLDVLGYNEGESDFRSQISKIKKSNPDIVFIPSYLKETAVQLKQMKELGLNKPLLAVSSFNDPKIFELAGNAAEGVIFSTPVFDPEGKASAIVKFLDSFAAKYNEKPNIWAGYGYDVVRIAALAMEKGDAKADKIKDALYSIKNFPGVTGSTSFDKNGDVNKELKIMAAKSNKFVAYERK
jgi:branched-chain amino acid transport system substrate-binding protein